MSPAYTSTYSYTKTRTEAVVDQVDMFLQYAGIGETPREKILKGVEERWLEAVAAYLERGGRRILEGEIQIDWVAHSDLAVLTPTVRTDLPGWESGATPEVRTIGRRFGRRATELGLRPNYWVRFVSAVRNDPSRHQRLCPLVGVVQGSSPPDWASPPRGRSYNLLDLQEVSIGLREAT